MKIDGAVTFKPKKLSQTFALYSYPVERALNFEANVWLVLVLFGQTVSRKAFEYVLQKCFFHKCSRSELDFLVTGNVINFLCLCKLILDRK